jgi:CheY-like chemotaxis protein
LAISKFPYLFVLMDCQMPVLDGLQAAKRIREIERLTEKHVPIVGCSAHSNRDACLDVGMDDFVQKPVSASVITTLVRRYSTNVLPIHRHTRI